MKKFSAALIRILTSNKRLTGTAIVFLIGGLAIFISTIISQRNAIEDGGRRLAIVQDAIEDKKLVASSNHRYACSHVSSEKYRTGPTYCGAILEGIIIANSREEADSMHSEIQAELYKDKTFGKIKKNIAGEHGFTTEAGLRCSMSSIIRINDTIDSKKYRFEIRCHTKTPFSYYKFED